MTIRRGELLLHLSSDQNLTIKPNRAVDSCIDIIVRHGDDVYGNFEISLFCETAEHRRKVLAAITAQLADVRVPDQSPEPNIETEVEEVSYEPSYEPNL